MEKTMLMTINGTPVRVIGYYSKQEKTTLHYAPASFEVYQVFYCGLNVLPLLDDRQVMDLEEKALQKLN